jgi:hypothetical protein
MTLLFFWAGFLNPRHEGSPLNRAAPFRFGFLSAFSVPRSKHPRPSDARSPTQNPLRASMRCGLLPQSKFGSPPQIPFSRRGSGSRRHTRWASMYRRQRTNQKKRSPNTMFKDFSCRGGCKPGSTAGPFPLLGGEQMDALILFVMLIASQLSLLIVSPTKGRKRSYAH